MKCSVGNEMLLSKAHVTFSVCSVESYQKTFSGIQTMLEFSFVY